jgi:Flp pilus assembly protein TadG
MKSERGAAAVEFALIAPLLFMLIFGIIQFGLAWSEKEVFLQAAREGARYAAVGCENTCALSEIEDRVTEAAVGYQVDGPILVNPVAGCSNTNTDDKVRVGWTQSFDIDIPFVPPVSVNAPIEAVFRCEV